MKTLRKSNKTLNLTIQTMDAKLEFEMDARSYGRELMELVSRAIGLREVWYFGLQFFDSKGYLKWLKDDKRLCDQKVSINLRPSNVSSASIASTTSSNSSVSTTSNIASSTFSTSKNGNGKTKKAHILFLFLAKFYPEDVAEELIQGVTHHLFYLQVKQAILDQKIFCPPEGSVLLASYAVQAKYGDYDELTYRPGMLAEAEDLLPQRVIDQYLMTPEMWEERIRVWYADHKGMSSDEAELEYLKIAQDLDMYGINYFQISNKNGTKLWLGVTAIGLHIYELDNKLNPQVTFPWSEIKHISYKDKKFIIITIEKNSSPVHFYSEKTRMNKLILDLCIGNHDLYIKRRQPDSIELQQMKAQAREEKLRRVLEREKLEREKKLRQEAERERAEMEARLFQYQEEVRTAQERLRKSEELAELLDEKARQAEEETYILSQKSAETEAEMQQIMISAMKTEEEKMMIERKAVEAGLLASSMLEETELRTKETEAMKMELLKAKLAEKEAKDKLIDVLRASSSPPPAVPPAPSSTTTTSMVIHSPPSQFTHSVSPGHFTSPPPPPQGPSSNHPFAHSNQHLVTNQLNVRNDTFHPNTFVEHASRLAKTTSPLYAKLYPPFSPSNTGSSYINTSDSISTNEYSNECYRPNALQVHSDLERLTLEIEKERLGCIEKSRDVQNQLSRLMSEIQVLKVEEKITLIDRIHEQNFERGEDKNFTLKRTKSGTTRARVSFFEAL